MKSGFMLHVQTTKLW